MVSRGLGRITVAAAIVAGGVRAGGAGFGRHVERALRLMERAIENSQDSCPVGLRIAISMVTPPLLGGGRLSRSSSFGRAAIASGSRRPSRSCRRARRSRPVSPTFTRGFATKTWLRTGCGSGPISRGNPAPRFNATFSLGGQTVPEPTSLTLLALGAAGVFAAARARRRGRAILRRMAPGQDATVPFRPRARVVTAAFLRSPLVGDITCFFRHGPRS
jgi:hypothetical protein